MTRRLVYRRWRTCAAMTAMAVLTATASFAQAGQGAAPPMLVPLSGRSAPGGSVTATETAVPGITGSVDTLNPVIQVQGPFSGSTRSTPALAGALTLQEALKRGLEHNLGALNVGEVVNQSRGQRAAARSALLPNVAADLTGIRQQINLAAMGFQFTSPIPGFDFPAVVGPFNQVDLRARVSQTVFDLTALNNYRATSDTLRANELSTEDAQNLVVLAVAGTYLQAVAARARLAAGRAQLETADALYQQSAQRRAVGLVAQVDVSRSQVQALTQQQRLITLQIDFAKQKINLARMVGLVPTDQYEIGDDVPFAAPPALPVDEAVQQAKAGRADLKAAEAHLRAAERARAAAHAERLPSVSVSADYGAIGATLPDARGTFSIIGRVVVPIWLGGRTEGVIQQAEAAVRQRRAELDDLAGQIEGDVRKAYLEMDAAASQVELALRNQDVAQQTLELARQRFDAGIADSVEVVQGQESAAVAALDYINSVFAHNLAKLAIARSIGITAQRLQDFLKLP